MVFKIESSYYMDSSISYAKEAVDCSDLNAGTENEKSIEDKYISSAQQAVYFYKTLLLFN